MTNSLVIGIVIWLAGVSVKDYACLLVEQSPLFDQEKSEAFNRAMHSHLVNASLLAVSVAAVFHFYVVRKMIKPLRQLAAASREMAKGHFPAPVEANAHDEIAQLVHDFNKMTTQLEQVDEKRSKLLRDISHELRTPLTNINGYLEALRAGVIKGDQTLYASLYEESSRLTRLVEQLHELNVWESGEPLQERLREVPIHTIIIASSEAFRLELNEKNITCRCEIDEACVRIDPDGIKQVMHNLLKNAMTYDEGGWIKIDGKKAGSLYRVTVTNKGKPIPAEDKSTIFDRFTRLDASRTRDTGGAGLGLAIVKEIVTKHGGEVGLHSSADQIHAFWFTIPL